MSNKSKTEKSAAAAEVPANRVSSRTYDKTGKLIAVREMTRPREIQRRRVTSEVESVATALAPAPPRTVADDIRDAIGLLDPNDANAWTQTGKPKVEAIETVLGVPITEEQRDAVWASIIQGN
ncbi:MAG: hypothetical protein HYV17_08050 [Xanthomonadales bacterium]|nr:hypothetical protein [Xanthomonadales bacterium]